MSREVAFPLEFIGFDMMHDKDGTPWYCIQAKLGGAGNPKGTVVYLEAGTGILIEMMRVPEIYGQPRFYCRPNGQVIVTGPTHETAVKHLHHSDPIPGLVTK